MEIKDRKEIEKILSTININISKINHKCVIKDCSQIAINSHILQRNGILNTISTSDNHIYELKPKNIFKWSSLKFDSIKEFKKVGLLNAHSYPTLCSYHDSEIFKPIETHPIDFDSEETHLLFGFRTLLSMSRKEEIVKERELRMLNSKILGKYIQLNHTRELNKENLKVIEKLSELRNEDYSKFISDLQSGTNNFVYNAFRYPLKEIYSSSISLSINYLESIFVNIIPYNNETIVLLLTPKNSKDEWTNKYIDSWKDLNQEDFEKRLSTHLVLHCENWGISKDLLDTIPKEIQDWIVNFSLGNLYNEKIRLDLDYRVEYNIFEY